MFSELARKGVRVKVFVAGAISSVLLCTSVVVGATPAFASDYTLDCTATQGAPFVDYDAGDPYYGYRDVVFDGSGPVTITVTIQNCAYHYAMDTTGFSTNPYVGESSSVEYTLTIPVDGSGGSGGGSAHHKQDRATVVGPTTLAYTGTDASAILWAMLSGFVAIVSGLTLMRRVARSAEGASRNPN